MQITILGLHQQNVPAASWHLNPEAGADFLQLAQNLIAKQSESEFLFVDSSSAKEIISVTSEPRNVLPELKSFLSHYFSETSSSELHFHELSGPEAVRHFFQLALGLEPGSPQDFLQQTAESILVANQEKVAGSVINRLYQSALILRGKIKESETSPDAARLGKQIVELIRKIFGTGENLAVIVLGENDFGLGVLERCLPAEKNQIKYFPKLGFSEFSGGAAALESLFVETQVIFRLNQNAAAFFTAERLAKLMQKRKNEPLLILNLDPTISTESAVGRIYNLYNYDLLDFQHLLGKDDDRRSVQNLLEKELQEFFSWFYSNQFHRFGNIVVKSPAMEQVLEMIARIAQTDITVLIQGESGTGKEIVARTIHENSLRREKPFVVVNCGALTETLLESELFGHEKGAFTGATYTKKGLFEEAHQGTIFLDEIGDTSPALQVKLLRVLQEGEIKRVGSTETIRIDVRLIAATNQDLEELVRQGRFRQDLFYRLNVVNLRIPPLRERREEILPLAEYFLGKYSDRMKKRVTGFTERAKALVMGYDWPGNVRELENAVERAVALAIGNVVHSADLPDALHRSEISSLIRNGDGKTRPLTLKEIEKQAILSALHAHNWNYDRVAEILDIGRTTLWRKMKEYGIKKPE